MRFLLRIKSMIVTMFLTLTPLFVSAQVATVKDSLQSDEVIVEIVPSFPGGHDKLIRFVKRHQKKRNVPNAISGKVLVEFVVEKTGELTEIQVVRGLCDQCDVEAVRLVKAMPKWTPGSQGGKLVRTRMVLPVIFN